MKMFYSGEVAASTGAMVTLYGVALLVTVPELFNSWENRRSWTEGAPISARQTGSVETANRREKHTPPSSPARDARVG